MREQSPISRRQALAAVGAGATGVGGYLVGIRSADSVPDWLAGRNCDPAPLVTSQTDWTFPRHDRANTGHAPDRAGQDWPLEETLERDWPIGNLFELTSLVVADGVVVALLEAQPRDVLLALSIDDGRLRWRQWVEDAYRGRVCAASGFAFVQGEVSDSSTRFAARLRRHPRRGRRWRGVGPGETVDFTIQDDHLPDANGDASSVRDATEEPEWSRARGPVSTSAERRWADSWPACGSATTTETAPK